MEEKPTKQLSFRQGDIVKIVPQELLDGYTVGYTEKNGKGREICLYKNLCGYVVEVDQSRKSKYDVCIETIASPELSATKKINVWVKSNVIKNITN